MTGAHEVVPAAPPAGARNVLITGGSRGIGAATARLCAARGYDIAILYQRDDAAAAATVAAIQAAGRRGIAIKGAVEREADVVAAFDAAERALGPVWGLVNNAGITGPIGRLEGCTAETVRAVLEVNVLGSILCAREAVRRMSTARGGAGGAIVNISSVAAVHGAPNTYVWYAAAKGAIDAFTHGLAVEVAREGIRVNALQAGVTDTELHAAGGDAGRAARIGATVPIGRAARPEEMAEAIVWLLSDAASYCVGGILRAGGGR